MSADRYTRPSRQLSAFFPFYRNHNTIYALAQEPYRWSSVIGASKTAMNIRYSLLPYMYTLMNDAHLTGSTVMRALAWEFQDLPQLAAADRQFMLGPSLLVIPVLTPGADSVSGVFPGVSTGTIWYDWYNQSAICDVQALSGANVSMPAPLGHIPVFVRGGSILPMQPLQGALTIRDAQTHAWELLVGLDADGAATGSLYLDDGYSVVPNATLSVDMTVAQGCLYASGIGSYMNANPLSNVTVMGVMEKPGNVTLNGKSVSGFTYNAGSKLLQITGLEAITPKGAWSQDWSLKW